MGHHVTTLTDDRSLKADNRQRKKAYLLKWRQPKMLIGYAMYVEALLLLSLTLTLSQVLIMPLSLAPIESW